MIVSIIRAVFGIVFVFFIPGFAWTLVLFKQITYLERLVLSFGLSLALVTLGILGLNAAINMKITELNAFLTILMLTIIPLAICSTRRYMRKRKMKRAEDE
jgi:uncharacterized membrane protein